MKDERKVDMVKETEVAENELLNEYRSQTLEEGKHDVHIDGYYSDYSESSCCC